MENIVLKMHYDGKSVDVKVDDTDRCLLIDVINDLYDEAEKNVFSLPRHPSLGYSFQMKSVKLLDDKGLLEMFNRFTGRTEIDIWIGCDETSSHVLTLARQLRASKQRVEIPTTYAPPDAPLSVCNNREKLQFRRNMKPSCPLQKMAEQGPPVIASLSPKVMSPRRSSRVSETGPILTEPMSPPKSVMQGQNASISPKSLTPRRSSRISGIDLTSIEPVSPRRSGICSQGSVRSSLNQIEPIVVDEPRFKLSRSTAKLKGVFVPKLQSKTKGKGQVDKRVTRGVRVEYNAESEDSDTDGSYMPSDEEVVDDEEADTGLEHEDNLIISTLECIDDGYDPYENGEWIVDEGAFQKFVDNGEIYEDQKFGAIKLRPWMLFMDKDHFKEALRDYCVQEGFYVTVVKSDKFRYTADCATLKCEWRIHASVLPDGKTWAIKTIRNPEHGCAGVKTHNPMASVEWVSKKLVDDIRANQDISAASLQMLLMDRYGLKMKSSSLYRMKEKALKYINGGHDESYALLPAYVEMIKRTNPRSYGICAWTSINSPQQAFQFKSIFVSFYAQFSGLIQGCRSLIGVDGTHLKGDHRGVLLSAIALDGNNEIFPVAVSVVDSETKDSWSNFFWHLKHILAESGRVDWTIICDRQKGVEPALDDIWPESQRRFCARHLCRNFKSEYPGILMHKLFWRVVNSYSEFTFKKALELLVVHGGHGSGRWLIDLGDKEKWARHRFDPKISCDANTSNFVESFNNTLGVHRCKPILSLLEGIRRMTMVRHATRQHVAENWSDDGICPGILARLRVLTKDSRTCTAYASGRGEFEVHDGKSHLPVSLNNRTCACGQWQISGIPCKHAIRAIIVADKEPSHYVSDWYSVVRYKAAYGVSLKPIPDSDQWDTFNVPTLVPPPLKRAIGRPSRNRRREPGEKRKGKRSMTVKCKKCQCFGHNSRTCKGGYTAKEKGEMQGQGSSQTKKGKRKAITECSNSQETSQSNKQKRRKAIGPSIQK